MSEPQAARPPEPPHLLSPVGPDGTAWTWRFRADFAPWIRDLRVKHALTLRDAAERNEVLGRAGYKMEVPAELRDAVRCDDAFARDGGARVEELLSDPKGANDRARPQGRRRAG